MCNSVFEWCMLSGYGWIGMNLLLILGYLGESIDLFLVDEGLGVDV